MKAVPITEAQLDQLLDTAFNPPEAGGAEAESEFYAEWKDVQSHLKSALLELGYRSWNDDGEDYTMADDWGLSRSHDIEVHSEPMWRDLRVLSAVQGVVESLEKPYQVVVHHDLFLRGETPMCHFIIQKDAIMSQTDDPKLLNQLGLET